MVGIIGMLGLIGWIVAGVGLAVSAYQAYNDHKNNEKNEKMCEKNEERTRIQQFWNTRHNKDSLRKAQQEVLRGTIRDRILTKRLQADTRRTAIKLSAQSLETNTEIDRPARNYGKTV